MRTVDPALQVARLLAQREPIYAQADLIVDSSDRPHGEVVNALIRSLLAHLERRRGAGPAP